MNFIKKNKLCTKKFATKNRINMKIFNFKSVILCKVFCLFTHISGIAQSEIALTNKVTYSKIGNILRE